MFGMLNVRSLSANALRTYFLIYAIRHTVGIALFLWICIYGYQAQPKYLFILIVGLAVYAGSALYNGVRLWQRYQARKRLEETDLAPETSATAVSSADVS